jgi:hypothetical protein
VGDDDLIVLAYASQLLHRINDVVLLNFGGGTFASLQECVTT